MVIDRATHGKDCLNKKMKAIFKKIASDDSYYLLVARDDENRATGTAMGVLCNDLSGLCDPFMLVENVIVSEERRGSGGGKMLMAE